MARPVGQGELTKLKIAEHAQSLFETKGYNATSMADIRDNSGFSKGTIYHHFKNKEDLYLYCIREASNRMLENCKQKTQQVKTVKEKLYILAEIYAYDVQAPLTKTVSEFLANNEQEMDTHIFAFIEPEKKIFELIIEEGIRNNELREDLNVKDTTMVLYSMLTGLISAELFGYKDRSFHQLYEQAITLFLEGVSNK